VGEQFKIGIGIGIVVVVVVAGAGAVVLGKAGHGVAVVWQPPLLGGERGDKGRYLAGGAEEHVVIESGENRAADGGGHEAEGMGVRAGCKGSI